MATRLYFPATDAAAVSPSFDSGWNYTSEAARGGLTHTKGSSPITEGTRIGAWSNTAGQKALDRQYISSPLNGDQTISGTVKMQLLVREFATSDNADQIILAIKVVSNDGSSVRGTLLSLGSYGPTAEFLDTSHRNKTGADGDSLTSVNALDTDRILVEIGYSNSTTATTPEASAQWGENATDLGENETDTAGAGWIEFSGAITFVEPKVRVSQTPIETALAPTGIAARISQTPIETVISPTGIAARLSQLPIETIISPTGIAARLSQVAIEVIYIPSATDPARSGDFFSPVTGF